jgi:hypothetical protein
VEKIAYPEPSAETGPSMQGFQMNQTVIGPDRRRWKIIGVDHPRGMVTIAAPDRTYPIEKTTLSTEQLRAFQEKNRA